MRRDRPPPKAEAHCRQAPLSILGQRARYLAIIEAPDERSAADRSCEGAASLDCKLAILRCRVLSEAGRSDPNRGIPVRSRDIPE
jgi:hypothetical protein